MTEEQNLENKEEKCNCLCRSKGFRKFVIVALGTFVGVYCALSLFTALHRPPMPMCPMGCPMMRPQIQHHQHFDRGNFENFDKQIIQHKFDKKVPPKPQEEMER